MTLFEQVTGWIYHQQNKHQLGEDYTENLINNMSNFELLQAISEALECITPVNGEIEEKTNLL